jgi:hypothetical protein
MAPKRSASWATSSFRAVSFSSAVTATFIDRPACKAKWRVAAFALRHDAFEVVLAGLGEEGRAPPPHMIRIPRGAPLGQVREQRRQRRLALDRGQASEIATVEMQEIEDVKGQPCGLAAGEGILQRGEAGDAIGAQHGDLARPDRRRAPSALRVSWRSAGTARSSRGCCG